MQLRLESKASQRVVARRSDILAVDDIPLNLDLLEGILSTRGHQLRRATSGEEALAMMQQRLPDLVLLDVMMPGMDGFEVCEQLKTNTRSSDIPVIFVSALSEIGHKLEAFHAGGVDYITRPYDAVEVLARVEAHLRLRDFQGRLEERVRERTAELRAKNRELQHEIQERQHAETKLQESHRHLRELSAHLLQVREDEKAEIAREIHDEFGAVFTALAFGLSWLEKRIDPDQQPLLQRTSELREQVAQAAVVARRIQTELRPTILDDLGLEEAIAWQVNRFRERTGIDCTLYQSAHPVTLSTQRNIALFRILQEALTNIARHAEATHAEVKIEQINGTLLLAVHDNGIGISEQAFSKKGSYGIRGMRERTHAIGGTIDAGTPPEGGTWICVRVPLREPLEE